MSLRGEKITVSKIIKRCWDCPLSWLDAGNAKAYCYHPDMKPGKYAKEIKLVTVETGVPDWCPVRKKHMMVLYMLEEKILQDARTKP